MSQLTRTVVSVLAFEYFLLVLFAFIYLSMYAGSKVKKHLIEQTIISLYFSFLNNRVNPLLLIMCLPKPHPKRMINFLFYPEISEEMHCFFLKLIFFLGVFRNPSQHFS